MGRLFDHRGSNDEGQRFQPDVWEFHEDLRRSISRRPGNNLSAIDAFLQWHYEQAVLCNMRGGGETLVEFDFPPGTDIMEEIRDSPRPAEWTEAKRYNRRYGLGRMLPSYGPEQDREHTWLQFDCRAYWLGEHCLRPSGAGKNRLQDVWWHLPC
ncbi:hypothetical protein BDV26DRAFT_254336 [Aspergillus bertholletiae]|uniref:Uncharacterized protein n=1 Tax=Aspergillus bertholletiae TaxID=1226010 RepID=A0A5N7BJW7_9EURO|nr:hypothetical protein BDV26DRAFT_254336 [Aspergillus bertholletiae]